MIQSEASNWVWSRLPWWKHLVGRKRVFAIIARTHAGLVSGKSGEAVAADETEIEAGIGIIPMMLLSAVIGEVVRLLIEWFKERAGK